MADASTTTAQPVSTEAPPRSIPAFNAYGVWAIYRFQMARFFRTIGESVATPVITTALYFVVFGSAIGSRIDQVGGVDYGSFIVPGLIMLSLFTQSIFNASFGIYFPKFTGTIYEILSAPVSFLEIILAYVGAAATHSVIIGLITLITATFFVDVRIEHPVWMVAFLILIAFPFSLFGFIIGIWAQSFEQLNFIPMLIVTPMTFLGGVFYTLDMLPPGWRELVLFNPIVYLVSGYRWTFFGIGDVPVAWSLAAVGIFIAVCLAITGWIFKTGYRLKN